MRRRRTRGPEEMAGLLRAVLRGRFEARTSEGSLAVLDGDARELTVDLHALGGARGVENVLRETHLRLWSARGVPSALARAGWTVRIREGDEEVVRLGHAVGASTGHIAVHPLAAWRARRAERATNESP